MSIRIRIGYGYWILGIGYGRIKTLPDQIEFEYGRKLFVPFTSSRTELTIKLKKTELTPEPDKKNRLWSKLHITILKKHCPYSEQLYIVLYIHKRNKKGVYTNIKQIYIFNITVKPA